MREKDWVVQGKTIPTAINQYMKSRRRNENTNFNLRPKTTFEYM